MLCVLGKQTGMGPSRCEPRGSHREGPGVSSPFVVPEILKVDLPSAQSP